MNTIELIKPSIKILPLISFKLTEFNERLYLIKYAKNKEKEQIPKSIKKIIHLGTIFIFLNIKIIYTIPTSVSFNHSVKIDRKQVVKLLRESNVIQNYCKFKAANTKIG